MGLHTGEPQVGEQRYVGMGVHKAARIGAAGHGGQVLLSATTRELVEDELPPGVTIRDLGVRRLKDVERPERLSQLVIEGLPSEFDALKTLDVELARRRRRMYVGAALIGVLAAAVAIPVFALGQGSGGGSANVAPNSVAIIDPDSNNVVGTVPVGVRPSSVVVGEGAVWVANVDDRTMSRIDPTTRTVGANTPLEATPTGLAVGARSVWIANGLAGHGVALRPGRQCRVHNDSRCRSPLELGSDRLRRRVRSGSPRERGRSRASTSRRNAVVGSGIAGVSPSGIASADGYVWIANEGDNTVSQMNPRTMGVVEGDQRRPQPERHRGRRRLGLGHERGRRHRDANRRFVGLDRDHRRRARAYRDRLRRRRRLGGEQRRRHGVTHRSGDVRRRDGRGGQPAERRRRG